MWQAASMVEDRISSPRRGPDTEGFDVGSFVCPRCGSQVAADFYGPCDPCRSELRSSYEGRGRAVEAAAYEPKMNVTPNAVALKD
jgi:hypothetical protein